MSFKQMLPASLKNLLVRLLLSKRNYLSIFLYGKITYNQDGLMTIHNADFMCDPHFLAAYVAGKKTGSWTAVDIQWRAHVICWAATKALSLEGDFVECGVNRGGLAMTAMTYVNFGALPKTFYLLDTFNGLVEKYISKEEKARGISAGGYQECYEAVVETFKPFPNVKIVRGAVPDTLPQVQAKKISYLSIDMNSKIPEIAAAEYFWDKLVSGAVIVLDDYGWSKHIEQKRAFDEFAQARGVQVLALPTGQGLIVKP